MRCNLRDGAVGNGDVGGGNRGKIVETWSWTTAPDTCCWDEDGLELRVLKLPLHFTCQLGAKLSLGGTGGHKKWERSIDAGLAGLAECREGSGIVLEVIDLR